MHIFEVLMLICFGAGWPFSIAKSLNKKVVAGKSALFMVIISMGYIFGILNKILVHYDWVVWLYVLNLLMVSFDLYLYYYYSSGREKVA